MKPTKRYHNSRPQFHLAPTKSLKFNAKACLNECEIIFFLQHAVCSVVLQLSTVQKRGILSKFIRRKPNYSNLVL